MPLGQLLKDELLARPRDEDPWMTLRWSHTSLVQKAQGEKKNVLQATRLALSTASLRARTIARPNAWAGLLAPIVVRRLSSKKKIGAMAAGALTQSALVCR